MNEGGGVLAVGKSYDVDADVIGVDGMLDVPRRLEREGRSVSVMVLSHQ